MPEEIKLLEAQGFSFEAAEASVAMMMKRQQPGYTPPFELIDFSVNVEHRRGRGIFAEATSRCGSQQGRGPAYAAEATARSTR
jgi:hypothetical protein